MAEPTPNNTPLVIIAVAIGAVILYMLFKPQKVVPTQQDVLLLGPPADPCLKADGSRIPDWACGAVSIINPLAQAGTAVYQTKVNADIQKAQIRRGYY